YYYFSGIVIVLLSFPTRRSSDLGTDHALAGDFFLHQFDIVRPDVGHRAGVADITVLRRRQAHVTDFGPAAADAATEQIHLAEKTDRKSTRLNSSHVKTSYAVFCL